MEKDQTFVEFLVKAIVNNPDDVKTDRTIDERGVLITLHVNPADMGYVIGRSGQTARSIRTLLKIVGAKDNARVNLKIYEPEGSRRFATPAVDADGNVVAAPVGAAIAQTPVTAVAANDSDDFHDDTDPDTSVLDSLNI